MTSTLRELRLASKASAAAPCSPLRSLVVMKISSRAIPEADRRAHACFVAIGGGRVDVPATGFQRSFHHALSLILRDLEDAEAELGNTDPVVQRQVRDGDHDTSRTGSSLLAMYAASPYQLASTTQRERKA